MRMMTKVAVVFVVAAVFVVVTMTKVALSTALHDARGSKILHLLIVAVVSTTTTAA